MDDICGFHPPPYATHYKIPDCACARFKATLFHWTLVYGWQLVLLNSYLFALEGEFTERSYTRGSWHTEVRHGSESLTDPMVANIFCSEKGSNFYMVIVEGQDWPQIGGQSPQTPTNLIP